MGELDGVLVKMLNNGGMTSVHGLTQIIRIILSTKACLTVKNMYPKTPMEVEKHTSRCMGNLVRNILTENCKNFIMDKQSFISD